MVQKEQWYTSWGPKKLIFLIRDTDDAAMAAASVESCRFVVLRSPGSRSRVGTIHVQSRTPHARPLPSVDIYGNSPSQTFMPMICQSFGSRALWRAPSTGASGVGNYPTPDLPPRESGSRSTSEKSKLFGPDGAPFPSKTSISLGPQKS